MIRNDRQYEVTKERARAFEVEIARTQATLVAAGHGSDAVELATVASRTLLEDLQRQVSAYERLVREGLSAVPRFPAAERGKELTALRVARRVSEGELARRLGIPEEELVRGEENDHFAASEHFFHRVLEALGVEEDRAHYRLRFAPFTVELPRISVRAASFDPIAARATRLTGS